MLCFRCEHRAKFLEDGHAPRCECGDIESSKCGCYMYKPCLPVIVKPSEGEERPMFAAPMISGRIMAVRVAKTKEDVVGNVCHNEDGSFVVWEKP